MIENQTEHESSSDLKVYIIVLNYNNFNDTIDCLDSLLKLSYSNKSIIVCDNGSTDGSFQNIVTWAAMTQKNDPEFKSLVLRKDQITFSKDSLGRAPLVLIDNQSNLGYAGGNNIGLRYAMSREDLAFGWILNNDTVVREDALCHLVEKMTKNPAVGLCGSTLLYRHVPGKIQALGGFTYNQILGISRQIGNGGDWTPDMAGAGLEASVEQHMFGIQGASMFVRRAFLEQIGLMSEDYFLYSEEADWAMKTKGKFLMGYASSSLVFHKEGPSTGSNSYSSSKSLFSEYFLTRNRLVFTQKYFPFFLPTVLLGNVLISLKRFLKGQYKNGLLIVLCSFDFIGGVMHANANDSPSPFDRMKHFFDKPLSRFLFKGKSVS